MLDFLAITVFVSAFFFHFHFILGWNNACLAVSMKTPLHWLSR